MKPGTSDGPHMIEISDRPLLTFAVCAYKQEHLIREAVEGALAQTYSPLQIILSDDASGDRTFEIMSEMARAYSGPHRIVLNRNPTNRGIGGHINRLMELCEGEMLVGAAGDDISLPKRVEVIYERWHKAGRPVGSIFSDVVKIAEDGIPFDSLSVPRGKPIDLLQIIHGAPAPIIGSAHCWHRRVFEVFGPLREGLVNEDSAIFYRSAMLGSVLHIHEPLVHHRIHGANTGACGRSTAVTSEQLLRVWKTGFGRQTTLLENLLLDLHRFHTLSNATGEYPLLVQETNRALEFSRAAHAFVSVGVIKRLLMLLPLLSKSRTRAEVQMIVIQCLFPGLHSLARRLKGKLVAIVGASKNPPPASSGLLT